MYFKESKSIYVVQVLLTTQLAPLYGLMFIALFLLGYSRA